jgi:PAS domain S-box-containing protein
MTVTVDSTARVQDAAFELEFSSERWAWSPSMFGILGVSKSLRPTTTLLVATMHPDDRPITRRVIEDALDHRRSFCFQSRVVRGDGQLRTVEATGTVVLAPNGSPRALVGSVAVISDWDTLWPKSRSLVVAKEICRLHC